MPQLHLKIPRIILSSSTCLSIQLLRASEAQSWFDAVCQKFSVDPTSLEPVTQLRDVDVEELIAKTDFAKSSFRPIWDDVTITFDPREAVVKPSLWDEAPQQIVFGVCKNEVGKSIALEWTSADCD